MFKVGDILGISDGRANTYKVREVREDGHVKVDLHTNNWGQKEFKVLTPWYKPDLFWLAKRGKKSNEEKIKEREKAHARTL
jgi:hypothetical protein